MARRPTTSPLALEPDPAWHVVVLHGKDAFLRLELTARLRAALVAEHGDIETFPFDGEGVAAADVLDECRSFGLMQQHKLVVVENADRLVNADTRPLLERYAQAPCDHATLLLRSERWTPGNLDKAVARVGLVCKCEGVSESEALAWAVRECPKRHGVPVERPAAQMLVDRLGPDLGRIDSDLARLAVAAGGPITPEVVAELVGVSRQENPWEIQSVLLSGDPGAVLRHLRLVLDNAPRDAHIPVVFAYTDLAAKLHAMAVAKAQRTPPAEAVKALKLWGPAKDALVRLAPRLRPARTRRLLRACIEADKGLKSGLGDPERVLERLGIAFAAVTRSAGR
jgi:DNA polymerase III subunit delta